MKFFLSCLFFFTCTGIALSFYARPIHFPIPNKGESGVVLSKLSNDDRRIYLDSNCFFINMAGKVIKHWPGELCLPYQNNSMLTVINGALSRISMQSEIIWSLKNESSIHHSVTIGPNENIYALSYELRKYKNTNVLFDSMLIISPHGKILRRWSSFDQLDKNRKYLNAYTHRLDKKVILEREEKFKTRYSILGGKPDDDYHHMNSIHVLKRSYHQNRTKLFKKGDILLSFNKHNFIALLDSQSLEIIWTYYPYQENEKKQFTLHSANFTEDGNITIFLNGLNQNNSKSGQSRAIEINPLTKKILWQFPAKLTNRFFSEIYGSVLKLKNGNYLITDFSRAKGGRAFEVTDKYEIVWQWIPPKQVRNPNKAKKISHIHEFLDSEISNYIQE